MSTDEGRITETFLALPDQVMPSLSKPASDMLLAMCEVQFNQLIEYVGENACLLQACRELDEVAVLLGPMRPERSFEDEVRAYLDWQDELEANAERAQVEVP